MNLAEPRDRGAIHRRGETIEDDVSLWEGICDDDIVVVYYFRMRNKCPCAFPFWFGLVDNKLEKNLFALNLLNFFFITTHIPSEWILLLLPLS